MAAIENLEIVVDVDIGEAVAKLSKLQDELQDLAESIERVDAQGTEGIDIRTNLDNVDDDLAALKAKIEAFESANDIDIDTDIRDGFAFLDMSPEEFLGRSGLDMDLGTKGPMYDEMFDAFADADLDFGGFNIERGRGISVGDDDRGMNFSGMFRRLRRQFSKVNDSLSSFDLRMSDMHNMMARLIPLLLVFIGVIPAAVTALVGLASAAIAAAASLAAIVGLGALGVGLADGQFNMDRLTDMLETVREDFIEAFAPLAERLQPIFEDAIDGLGRFFQAVADQGQALMSLTDEARALGGFIMDFVPGALRTLAGLVEAMAPIFANIGQSIDDNFSNIVRTLVELTAEAVPIMAKMAQRIAGALPAIARMSVGFARVANWVMVFVGGIFRLLGALGISAEAFGFVTAGALTLASAVALAHTRVLSFILGGLMSAFMWLRSVAVGAYMASGAVSVFGSTALGSAISALIGFTVSLINAALSLVGFSISAYRAAVAAAAFWSAVTLGAAAFLIPMIADMASGFLGLSNDIDKATSSLKEFDRVSGRTDASGMNPYGGDPPSSGAGAAGGPVSRGGGGSNVTVNIESSGDRDEDASNARYAAWRTGRTTGGNN